MAFRNRPYTHYWHLHANQKANGTTAEQCVIETKGQQMGYLRSVRCLQFCMPWEVHNITVAKNNNYFRLHALGDTSKDAEYTVPDGHYTYTRLASVLAAGLTADKHASFSSDITCTYDSGTHKFTMNVPVATGGFWEIHATSSLAAPMGFSDAQIAGTIAENVPEEAAGHPYLLSTQNVYVVMRGVDHVRSGTMDKRKETLVQIPVDVGFGGMLIYDGLHSSQRFIHNHVDAFEIELYDDDGNLLVNQNRDWSMLLECNYVRD